MGWLEEFFHPGPYKIYPLLPKKEDFFYDWKKESLAAKEGDLELWLKELQKRPPETLTAIDVATISITAYEIMDRRSRDAK